jgi:aconitate hydratase
MTSKNSFNSRATLDVGGAPYAIYRLSAIEAQSGNKASRLPFSLKILLENLLRNEDDAFVKADDILALARWDVKSTAEKEIAFRTSRVLLQDFTGVPAVVDLAAMRDAIKSLGGNPQRINPLQPVDLVIDHSVQVDEYGSQAAFLINTELEFERNKERYVFLRWGQDAFKNFRVVPPGTGICHQVNLEYLGKTVFTSEEDGATVAYPDSLVGTDSHTTMINGLGVLGWGVGGIEAEAAMLGQPVSMLIPEVVGFKLHGKLPPGATATDLVLTVTEMLRKKKVVGKFVEFYGTGLTSLPLADRATIANMARNTGRRWASSRPMRKRSSTSAERPAGASRQARRGVHEGAGSLPHRRDARPNVHGFDRAGPRHRGAEPRGAQASAGSRAALARQGDVPRGARGRSLEARHARGRGPGEQGDGSLRVARAGVQRGDRRARREAAHEFGGVKVEYNGESFTLRHGAVVIAAITSCTNTSNPSVMLAAGLLARNAVRKGLTRKPWVKTSLAPGSKVVTDYLNQAGVQEHLDQLGFQLVGYGCTTCIGNSGTAAEPIAKAIEEHKLVTAAVLSGNRNFEGRVNPLTRFNYLASPPLVVAYALAGRMDLDLTREPIGIGTDGPCSCATSGRSAQEVADEVSEREERVLRASVRRRLQGRRAMAVARTCPPARPTVGCELDVREEPAVLRGE